MAHELNVLLLMVTCVVVCVYMFVHSDVLGYYMGHEVPETVHDSMAVQIPTAIPIGMYRKGQVIIGQPSMLGPNINCIRAPAVKPTAKCDSTTVCGDSVELASCHRQQCRSSLL